MSRIDATEYLFLVKVQPRRIRSDLAVREFGGRSVDLGFSPIVGSESILSG
jgi:hypothetical protein